MASLASTLTVDKAQSELDEMIILQNWHDKGPVREHARFKVDKVLGGGSQGKVFCCTLSPLNTRNEPTIPQTLKRAVKFYSRRRAAESIQVLLDEVENAWSLREHPYCMTLMDVFLTRNYLVLSMRMCHGALRDLINENKRTGAARMDIETARRFFQQIILLIQYAHLNSIVFRDLKPENLLYVWSTTRIDKVVLSDFSWSRYPKGEAVPQFQSAGAPAYAAPEIIAGVNPSKVALARTSRGMAAVAAAERAANEFQRQFGACDVWSAAVILFELLFGCMPVPLRGTNNSAMMTWRKHMAEAKVTWPKGVREDMKYNEALDLLDKMLQPEHSRISLRDVMKHRFFAKYPPQGARGQLAHTMAEEAIKRSDANGRETEWVMEAFQMRVHAAVAKDPIGGPDLAAPSMTELPPSGPAKHQAVELDGTAPDSDEDEDDGADDDERRSTSHKRHSGSDESMTTQV